MNNRRDFIKSMGLASIAYGLGGNFLSSCARKSGSESKSDSTVVKTEASSPLFFKISLAEWSFHKALQAHEMDHLDFPAKAKNDFGIGACEYVNQFFKSADTSYLKELKKRCDDLGVVSVLIMCDDEGELASADAKKRHQSAENHKKWVEAAKFLGCHSIRVNAFGTGTPEEMAKAAADGLHQLAEFAQPIGINVIVENHGGNTSNGQWLSGVIRSVGLPNCGTLPDFGNFCTRREKGDMWNSPCVERYDNYKGVAEMMPFAKGVSAKSYDFDAQGNCTEIDYPRMLKIVKDAGYTGYIGIEYEGSKLSEPDGVRATKSLLERAGAGIS